ncbi:oligosaccharide repeat unit polymerase, partial [Yersinia pestis]
IPELVRFLEEILISLVPYFLLQHPVLYSFSITLLLEKMPERFFFINVLLFVLLELLKGWSGFLLTIFMFEIYFYIKRNSSSRLLKIPFLFSITLPFILLLSGGFLYKHIYILKNDIRGISVVSDNLEYIDAVEMLSDRLTNFSTAAGVYSRYDSVVDIAKLQNEYAEIKGFFRPLVPNFIMENKSFSALNNSAMLAFFPDYRDDSSVDLGFVMYYYVLFESRVSDAFLSLFLSFFLCVVLSVIFKILSKNNQNINLLIFIMIFSLLYTSSNEMVFARGNIIILFYIPMLFLFGIARVKIKSVAIKYILTFLFFV